MRGSNGGRVYLRQKDGRIEIFSKHNQDTVIALVKREYL
jgi:hypothetical protein